MFCPHPIHSATVTYPRPIHSAGGTPAWLHDPAWVGALATVGLFVFAIVTAIFAALAYRKQSAEVALLQKEAVRDIEQRRRAQAAKVFIATGGIPPADPQLVRIHNTSEQPVYDLTASRADAAGLAELDCMMPGEEYRLITATDSELWLDFRDASGVRWRTTSRGELTESKAAPAPMPSRQR